jgi:ABC-type nitrate/sulfonate/bicarbonate transport system ATPase subunit
MLCITNFKKSFNGLVIFDGFSIAVPKGSFTALVGPSGCGKSTFFDVLTGIVPKDGGEITWQGVAVPHLRGKAAYMQQKDLLLPWLSLIDNALLPATIAGPAPSAEIKAKALFTRLGLSGFEGYLPGKVSGGMRQRCALVRTLMFEHELVLLDEPLSALDAITRRSLQSLLLLLQVEFGKTIVMITHDVEEALLLADEVLVLSRFPMSIRERYVPGTPKPRRGDDPELLRAKEQLFYGMEKESLREAV